jgi:hypothetical protein
MALKLGIKAMKRINKQCLNCGEEFLRNSKLEKQSFVPSIGSIVYNIIFSGAFSRYPFQSFVPNPGTKGFKCTRAKRTG